MNAHVLVPLLKSVVLLAVVEVLAADHDGPLHLHLQHDARQDAAADADVAGERALLVDVGTHHRLKTQHENHPTDKTVDNTENRPTE